MEKPTNYLIEITSKAEQFYFEILHYLYSTHSRKSANRKSEEILELTSSLDSNPHRGTKEESLASLKKNHRFLVYNITKRKTIKIIYFVDENLKTVFITDFFPTESNPQKIKTRS